MEEDIITIGLFGRPQVGKTMMCEKYTDEILKDAPTVDDNYKLIKIRGRSVKADIYAYNKSQRDFGDRNTHYQNCDYFIFVYSVVDKPSLLSLEDIYSDIQSVRSSPIKCLIAGNKIDLKNDDSIQIEEAEKLAEKFNCQVIETSAKTQQNIKKLFETAIVDFLNSKYPDSLQPEEGGCCTII